MVDMAIAGSRFDFISEELDQLLGMIAGDDDFDNIYGLLQYTRDYFKQAQNAFYDIIDRLQECLANSEKNRWENYDMLVLRNKEIDYLNRRIEKLQECYVVQDKVKELEEALEKSRTAESLRHEINYPHIKKKLYEMREVLEEILKIS